MARLLVFDNKFLVERGSMFIRLAGGDWFCLGLAGSVPHSDKGLKLWHRLRYPMRYKDLQMYVSVP